MNYYPPALDYALYALVSAGLICLFWIRSMEASRRRGLLKLAGCILTGLGFACGGVGGALFNLRAPHDSATGTLTYVTRHRGKNSYTEFYLRTPSRLIGRLSTSGDLPAVRDEELADVTYQAGSYRVLHLKLIDGPSAGYEQFQPDGSLGAYATLALAAAVILYGVFNFHSDGTGGPDKAQIASTPQPDGDVDTKSLIKL